MNRIVIHDNKGNLINTLEIHEVIIALQFLDNSRLLIIQQDGNYLLYCCQLSELSNLLALGDPDEFINDGIVVAKAVGMKILFITKSNKVFIKEIADRKPKYLLYQAENDKFFYQDGLPFFSLNEVLEPEHEIQVFLPLHEGGILKLAHSTKPKVERLLMTLKDQYIRISVSPNGENLAALTKSGILSVTYLKNTANVWKKTLGIDEGELSYLQKLEWVACYAVALVFKTKVMLACCGLEEAYFEMTFRDAAGLGRRTNHIITRSEIDGLRVIRIFEHSTEQSCCIIRRSIVPYAKFLAYSADKSPGKLVHEAYLAYIKEKPIEDQDDIRQFRAKLIEGVIELIDCACFELDEVRSAK
jgi:hypothetical protein